MSPARVCGGSVQNQATKLFRFFREDDAPQSTEVFYPDHGEAENEPIEKVYVTTLVTPMGLASSFNGRISKIMVKK